MRVFLVFVIAAMGLAGCTRVDAKQVVKIQLACIQLCKDMKDPPFAQKTFEDPDTIRIFVKAINKAEKINGVLDYGAIFQMTVVFRDGTNRAYHLNVDHKPGSQGLLVELPAGEQGYTIPESITDDLSEVIYH